MSILEALSIPTHVLKERLNSMDDVEVTELWQEFKMNQRLGHDYTSAQEKVQRELSKRGLCNK